ncbi:hypothetical protein [Moraxella oblonga]|uniref:hypothetical protein n=1 Tax=Moraxella oblonga TaxID=200413 RepID=UPI00083641E4|nr:hypothetical protein [Moraxella oblonga]
MNIKNQQGATLIMVLIVLLLISSIATIAMKTGMFGLRLSTNNQVDSLLLENNNSALFNLEDPSKVSQRLATNSMYGHFLSNANADDTLVFCYRSSQSEFFDITRASVLGNSKLGSQGYCGESDFSGGRQVVISQIYISRAPDNDGTPLAGLATGVSIGQGSIGITKMKMNATSISILPSFANSGIKDIVECLGSTYTKIEDSVNCLGRAKVPYNRQDAQYMIGTDFQNVNTKPATTP